MPDWLVQLLDQYGYVIVVVGVFLENAGVPLPGETVLLAAAFLAQKGMFSLPLVIGLATAAAILGDNVGYLIGRRGGRALVEKHGPKIGLTPARLAAIDRFFARHGAKTVFFARFVTGLRVFCALFAGISQLPWRRFLFFNATGAVVWATVCGAAGYLFGESYHLVEHWIGRAGLLVVGLVVAAAMVWLALRHRRRLGASLGVRELLLVIAHLITVAAFWVMAEELGHRPDTDFDHNVIMAVHGWASPALDVVMKTLTTIGSAPVVIPAVLAVMFWSIRRGDRRSAVMLGVVLLGTQLVNVALKTHFHRARPHLWVGALHVESYSFPSGHAMSAVAVYGLLAFVLARLLPRAKAAPLVIAPFLIFGIGLSRVYLGAHWPTDVIAGFLAGTFVLLLALVGVGRAEIAESSPPPTP